MQPWPDAGNGLSRGGGPRARSPPRTPWRGKSTRGDHRDPRGDPARRGGGRGSVERLPDRALGRPAGARVRPHQRTPRPLQPGGHPERSGRAIRHEHLLVLVAGDRARKERRSSALRAPIPARVPPGIRCLAPDGPLPQSESASRPDPDAAVPQRYGREGKGLRRSPRSSRCTRSGPPCSGYPQFFSRSASISSPRTRRPEAAHAAGGGVPAAAASPPGAGAVSATSTRRADSTSVAMYAATTATMISGATPGPALEVRSSATTTDDSGSRRIDTTPAPIKTATAGVSEKPGRCPARRPPTRPRNSAGKVGPPRKLPSEMLQAAPLKTKRSPSVVSDNVEASFRTEANSSWPENSTASVG